MGKDRPRAIIHTRVSTAQQEENTSHASQLAATLRKAEELKAEVVRTFQEEVSGALYKARPDIQESLAMIENDEADMLIFARLDRAGRDVDNLRTVKRRVEKAGGQLIFADGLVLHEGPVGTLMLTQLAGFAEYEREIIKIRTSTGLRSVAKNGIQPARARVPYGYRIPTKADILQNKAKPGEEGRYFIVEEHAAVVRDIFDSYVSGSSLRGISASLFKRGIPTPTGKPRWSCASLCTILRNPVYRGEASYGKCKSWLDEERLQQGYNERYQRRRDTNDPDYIRISCPVIVDPVKWQLANDKLDESREKHSGRRDRRYALTGLIRCPTCGSKLSSRHAFNNRKPNSSKNSSQFMCRFALPDNGKTCNNNRRYHGKSIERYLKRSLVYILTDESFAKEAIADFKAQAKKQSNTKNTPARIAEIKKQLAEISKREEATAEAKIEAKIAGGSEVVFNKLLGKLAAERLPLVEELQRLELTSGDREDVELFPRPPGVERLVRLLENDALTGVALHDVLTPLISRIIPVGERLKPAVIAYLISGESNYQWQLYCDSEITKLSLEVL